VSGAVDARAVIRGIYTLHGRSGCAPTAEEIAEHLKVKVGDVRPLLATLRRQRLFEQRSRRRQKVWMPWGETTWA
jgi:transcription initiation factor IIE alpha subunit